MKSKTLDPTRPRWMAMKMGYLEPHSQGEDDAAEDAQSRLHGEHEVAQRQPLHHLLHSLELLTERLVPR